MNGMSVIGTGSLAGPTTGWHIVTQWRPGARRHPLRIGSTVAAVSRSLNALVAELGGDEPFPALSAPAGAWWADAARTSAAESRELSHP